MSTRTLRRYTANGKLDDVRAPSGRRVFRKSEIETLMRSNSDSAVEAHSGIVVYGRVSSHRQQAEGDLDRQMGRLREAAGERLIAAYSDVASGLNDRRSGMRRAFDACARPEVGILMVEHRDRLARFGTRATEHLLGIIGVRLVVLGEGDGDVPRSPEEELVADLLAITTSFAGRLYGARSARAKRITQGVRSEVDPDG